MSNNMRSEINFLVELDDNRVPEKLLWSAKDGGVALEEAKAIMLSIWDSKAKESMRIDLWTKDMPVDEMKLFFYQTLVAMSDTFERATGDEKMSATMKDFCEYFAEKLDLIQK
jgi:gliding motility-associated protein GldC